jgi:hypothetical protein
MRGIAVGIVSGPVKPCGLLHVLGLVNSPGALQVTQACAVTRLSC